MTVKQGVKIVSPRAELTALRGLCHKDPRIAGTLLSSLDESYFYSDESVELFNYLRTQILLEGKPIKYKLLLEDPALSKEARSYIRDSEAIIRDVSDAKHSVKLLSRYRKRRGLYSIANNINEALMASRIDEDDVLHKIARSLGMVQRSKGSEDDFLHFGAKGNSHDFVKDLVYNKPEDAFIPTGIEAFDEVNTGLIRSSLMTVAGNSGSGKSHVAAALAKNMATAGYKVTVTPLEMSKREMTCRIIANVAQVDSLKLMAGDLTKNEKEHTWNKYMRWYKRMERRGGRYSVYKPPEDVTIYELFAVLDTYGADVNIVDYISLLAGVDGDDQWKQLGAVARFSKIHAETHNCVNILLAQLSDEGKIKYSRAITEHCVTGDTLIDTDRGLVRIDSFYPNAQVASTKELTGINVKSEGHYRPVSAVHYNGVRTVYEVRLSNGMTIKSTGQHRFRHLSKDMDVTWARLHQLNVGDYVAVDNTSGTFDTGNKDVKVDANPLEATYFEGYIDSVTGYAHNRFVQIESITKLGEEKVYDITVPGTENYVANGIVVHNSTNSWIFKADADSKELGILKVDQPKSRNQVSFPFTLKIDYSTSTIQSIRDGSTRQGNDSNESVPNLAADLD